MKSNTRRKFLKNAAILPIGMTLENVPSQNTNESKKIHSAASNAKIKLSLNAWSYNVPLYKHINGEEGGMSLFDMLDECARLDFDAVDPTGYFFPGYPEVPKTKFINEFKRRAFQLGLAISGTGIRNDFASADKVKRNADIALAKRWIEAAAQMGAPVLRVFAGTQPKEHTWEETASWMSDALAECAEHGEKHGVFVGVQNHGGMLKSADEVLKILNMVQSDWLGTIVDTGYFLTSDPYDDIKRVIPHAVNWQVKELLKDRKGSEIDLNKLVEIIRASNYRGYVPIETLPMIGDEDNYDAYARVPEFLDKLRKAVK
ncbi:sugar phosphate isomerase/epimerase [Aurantibacter crassamenti]|uniref:sugar phosphate isomerase/epimerase family protein n=1 Tax=Aurantibacter crassamenti TaxID=1837375 RepID=UPI00193AD03C|nr:sugar phosphate isomerase/epimerase family protein [Aurantibacter crassamenti]MBM1105749.1 sugar phosphate isomerase/epimerase [Aurantibacter crassamenti]